MIGRLTGQVIEEGADGTLVVDVGGVGYDVIVPLGTLGRLGESVGASRTVALHIHTHVREDAFLLYGFSSREDRAAFRALISVSNIGPKIAIGVLSALPAEELGAAIAEGNAARLTCIPGVGKKTAERMVLELKDKLPKIAARPVASRSAHPRGEKSELLVGALSRMGFRPAEVDRAVSLLEAKLESMPLSDLIRDALAILSA